VYLRSCHHKDISVDTLLGTFAGCFSRNDVTLGRKRDILCLFDSKKYPVAQL
jgi:hypothetical protein